MDEDNLNLEIRKFLNKLVLARNVK